MTEHHGALTAPEQLRQIYRRPSRGAVDKAVSRIDPAAAEFIALSPLCIVATGDGAALDASPRGGPPGFVKVINPKQIALGDLVGNNRLDSYTNVLTQPAVGMIFLVPGMEETLRINGVATVTEDPTLRAACAIDGRQPKVVLSVAVLECYLHCGAALRRAALWDTTTWPDRAERPSAGRILTENLHLEADAPAAIDADLEQYYSTAVWNVGGEQSDD